MYNEHTDRMSRAFEEYDNYIQSEITNLKIQLGEMQSMMINFQCDLLKEMGELKNKVFNGYLFDDDELKSK